MIFLERIIFLHLQILLNREAVDILCMVFYYYYYKQLYKQFACLVLNHISIVLIIMFFHMYSV